MAAYTAAAEVAKTGWRGNRKNQRAERCRPPTPPADIRSCQRVCGVAPSMRGLAW